MIASIPVDDDKLDHLEMWHHQGMGLLTVDTSIPSVGSHGELSEETGSGGHDIGTVPYCQC